MSDTLDIHVPLVNLSLANGQSSQPLGESVSAAMNINTGPVVIMAVHPMFTSYQIHHHAYCTASHLGTTCISSPLYDPYLASCSSHVLLMTRLRPIGYNPSI